MKHKKTSYRQGFEIQGENSSNKHLFKKWLTTPKKDLSLINQN